MFAIKSLRLTMFASLFFCCSVLATTETTAETPTPQGLFTTGEAGAGLLLPENAIKGRARAVQINHKRLRSGRLFLELPGGVSLDAVRQLQKDRGNGKYAWIGHAEGDKRNRVVLGVSGSAVAGTFAYNGRLFKLLPRADGSHVLTEVAAEDPAPEMDPIPVQDTGASAVAGATANVAADGNPIIDVLVAYTPRVESLYGTAGTEALIIQAVAETNQAYTNSGINPRLNLVHIAASDYVESGNMSTDINNLRGLSDGYMDDLHGLRDAYGADIVTLIEVDSAYCGLGYLMTSNSSSFASNAFNVVNHSCATGYYSFGHEIGHNQGAHHDPANASGAIYPYAYGHQDSPGGFRTVMAYSCSGCTRVDHFSNPEVSYNGFPTGVIGVEDNALTINTTAATVAGFRQQAETSPPSAPSQMAAVADGHSAVQLSWTDTSDNESGFLVERSEDGAVFYEVASLPAGAPGLVDDNLSAETLYYYRVRAWNSIGNSSYSNIVAVTTEAAPPYIDQLATADLPVAGTVFGTYRDTWQADGVTQTIEERHSGGKPKSRYSYLEHQWAFNVQRNNAVVLTADVTTTTTSDSFTFAYSSNGGSFVDMFSIDANSSGVRQFVLPPSLDGTVNVRVRDNVRIAGERTSHRVMIDYLVVRSDIEVGEPPASPADLTAAALNDSEIALTWADMSENEYGFTIERREESASVWNEVAATSANATTFTDGGLKGATLYHYRVQAFNGAGDSPATNSASAQTDVASAPSIQLSVDAYKVQGRQHADLSWTGSTASSIDVYRNGANIAVVVNSAGSYTDNIGKKGGGSYSYVVCEAGTSNCSDPVSAIF